MKTQFIILTSLFLFSVSLGVAVAAAGQPAVLDVNGKSVKVGIKYYVVPVQKNSGGGLDLAASTSSNNNKSCPNSVVQVGPKGGLGNTVVFTTLNPKKDDVVRNGTDLNIEFSSSTAAAAKGCPSDIWQITGYPDETDQVHYVVIGGEKGTPSYSNSTSYFMLLKTKNGYKFHFCPVALCDCNPVCQDIGISVEGGNRLLKVGTSLPTFELNFKRA